MKSGNEIIPRDKGGMFDQKFAESSMRESAGEGLKPGCYNNFHCLLLETFLKRVS